MCCGNQERTYLEDIPSKQCRVSPDGARPTISCFEEEPWKAKPTYASRRSFGGRSRGGQIRTDDLGALGATRYRI